MPGVSLAGPSRTAVLSAVGRALHAGGPPPYVISDRLAWDLAGVDGAEMLEALRARLSEAQLVSFSRWTSVRARFVEDLVEAALAAGVDQYVILGAGLDSFAYRRRDLLASLSVFEVDHPASQSWKRRRLSSLQIDPPAGLSFVPVDFEQETFEQVLLQAGFDQGRRAVVSWIGVTMYLTLEAIEQTLAALAGLATGSRIAITYDLPAAALTGLQLEVRDSLAALVSDLGEPFLTTFERDEAEALLHRTGFRDVIHFGPTDAVRNYFGGDGSFPVGGSQRLLAATVALPT
jgi:methyltransferase (TIGR00027 family)